MRTALSVRGKILIEANSKLHYLAMQYFQYRVTLPAVRSNSCRTSELSVRLPVQQNYKKNSIFNTQRMADTRAFSALMRESLVFRIIVVLVHPWLNGHAQLKMVVFLVRGAPVLPIFVNSCSQIVCRQWEPVRADGNNYHFNLRWFLLWLRTLFIYSESTLPLIIIRHHRTIPYSLFLPY